MEIRTTRASLYNGLTKVAKAINQKSIQAIMTCVMIEVTDGGVTLMGNDLEIGIKSKIDADCVDRGSLAVEVGIFMNIVNKMNDGDITLIAEDGKLFIKSGKSKFEIPYKGTDDYPAIPDVDKGTYFSIDSRFFKDMVKQVSFAADMNASNRVMRGIYLTGSDDTLTAVALDGFRIAVRKLVVENLPEIKAIVPVKSMNDIAKILGDSNIDIWVTDKFIEIDDGETTIIARLIDGEYMDISKILGQETGIKTEIERKSLYDSIDRATLLVRDGNKKPVVFDITGNNMDISALTVSGSMNESIDISHEGEDIRIGFNPKYTMDALSAIEDDTIKAYFSSPKAPAVIKDDEGTYVYIVLPVNLGG